MNVGTFQQMPPYTLWEIQMIFHRPFTILKYVAQHTEMFVSFCRNFLQLYLEFTQESLQDVFGQTEMDNESNSAPSPSAFGAMASFLVPKLTVGLSSNSTHDRSSVSLDQSKALRKERHAVRPPVQHNWSLPGYNDDAKMPQIFQHELLQNFSINMFCKV